MGPRLKYIFKNTVPKKFQFGFLGGFVGKEMIHLT